MELIQNTKTLPDLFCLCYSVVAAFFHAVLRLAYLRLTVFRFFRAARASGRAVIRLFDISSVSSLVSAPNVSGSFAVRKYTTVNKQDGSHVPQILLNIVGNTEKCYFVAETVSSPIIRHLLSLFWQQLRCLSCVNAPIPAGSAGSLFSERSSVRRLPATFTRSEGTWGEGEQGRKWWGWCSVLCGTSYICTTI